MKFNDIDSGPTNGVENDNISQINHFSLLLLQLRVIYSQVKVHVTLKYPNFTLILASNSWTQGQIDLHEVTFFGSHQELSKDVILKAIR